MEPLYRAHSSLPLSIYTHSPPFPAQPWLLLLGFTIYMRYNFGLIDSIVSTFFFIFYFFYLHKFSIALDHSLDRTVCVLLVWILYTIYIRKYWFEGIVGMWNTEFWFMWFYWLKIEIEISLLVRFTLLLCRIASFLVVHWLRI